MSLGKMWHIAEFLRVWVGISREPTQLGLQYLWTPYFPREKIMSTQPETPKSNSGGARGAAEHLGSHPHTAPSGHSAKFYANSFIEKDSAELFFVCLLCNEHNSFLPQLLREWTKWILPFRIPKARRKPPTSVRQCGRQACSLSLGNPRDLEGATWLPPKLARESNLQMEPWNQQKTMKENDQPKYHLQEATDGPECSSRKRESCHTLPRHTPAVVCIVLLVLLKAKHIPIKAILIPLSLSQ